MTLAAVLASLKLVLLLYRVVDFATPDRPQPVVYQPINLESTLTEPQRVNLMSKGILEP